MKSWGLTLFAGIGDGLIYLTGILKSYRKPLWSKGVG